MKNEMVNFFQTQMMTMFNKQKERIDAMVKHQMQQQKEQNDQMEAMMQQLLTTKEQSQRSTTMMAPFATPSPTPMQYPHLPYPPMPTNTQPRMPPLQPTHMLKNPAPIGNFSTQPYTQQITSPNSKMLQSQGSLDYQGEHLTQNNHVEHEMDLGANGNEK